MTETIIVALLSLVGTLGGTFGGIVVSAKLMTYRIEQLEKKVEKHNGVVERTFVVEGQVRELQNEVADLKEYHKP